MLFDIHRVKNFQVTLPFSCLVLTLSSLRLEVFASLGCYCRMESKIKSHFFFFFFRGLFIVSPITFVSNILGVFRLPNKEHQMIFWYTKLLKNKGIRHRAFSLCKTHYNNFKIYCHMFRPEGNNLYVVEKYDNQCSSFLPSRIYRLYCIVLYCIVPLGIAKTGGNVQRQSLSENFSVWEEYYRKASSDFTQSTRYSIGLHAKYPLFYRSSCKVPFILSVFM